jgi:hypothetical protein
MVTKAQIDRIATRIETLVPKSNRLRLAQSRRDGRRDTRTALSQIACGSLCRTDIHLQLARGLRTAIQLLGWSQSRLAVGPIRPMNSPGKGPGPRGTGPGPKVSGEAINHRVVCGLTD